MSAGSAADLLPATRNALALLLLAMADDEFVVGFSDSEWTGIAPILEEDVAMSSIAQDEIGHARALYELLAEVVADGRDADAIAYDRPPSGYYHARLLDHGRGDWAQTIARRYLYDTADAVRLEALADSSFAPVGRPRREDPARGALSPDARHDLARATGRSRRRAAPPAPRRPRAARARCRRPSSHPSPARPPSSWPTSWRRARPSSTSAGGPPSDPRSRDSICPCHRVERTGDRPVGSFGRLRAAPREFTSVRRIDPAATW